MRTKCMSALALGVFIAGPALAAPPGVTEAEGAWIAPDGKPLYTFGRDTTGVSNCNDRCASAWPPLLAEDDTGADADWSVVGRADGSRMWAYKGQPVYTFAQDTPGEAATGVSTTWPLAKR